MRTINRTKITVALSLAGCISSQGAMADQQKLTVALYGGNWGDAFLNCVAEPFTKATGIAVAAEVGTSTTTLAKLQQQNPAPPSTSRGWMAASASSLTRQA